MTSTFHPSLEYVYSHPDRYPHYVEDRLRDLLAEVYEELLDAEGGQVDVAWNPDRKTMGDLHVYTYQDGEPFSLAPAMEPELWARLKAEADR